MTRGVTASLAALAGVLLIGISYLTFSVVGVDWFTRYTRLTMVLADSGSLGPRSPVLLSGIRVGEVTGVRTVATGVEVALRVDDEYRIPVASTAVIENLSALGEPYVQFVPTRAGAPYLADGQTIETSAVRTPTSLPEVARRVTELLNQLDPSTIRSLIDTFSQGLAGTEAIMPQLARSTSLLAATLLSRTDKIRALLTDLQTLGGEMDWTGAALADAGPEWGALGGTFDDAAEAVAAWANIGDVPTDYTTGTGLVPFLDQLRDWVDRVGPELSALVPVLAPLAQNSTSALRRIDLGSLISQALEAVGEDGRLRVQIHVK
ncbi:MlaD family protein [Nocardia neocaledoniensis]|uniref:MlaD family protein n=1 Tax=Nocardia neocaledoniensis TaxID=236511 RepID=UPI002457ECA0|nr:MlaD family protein [Nocardia neocaledoniensis]